MISSTVNLFHMISDNLHEYNHTLSVLHMGPAIYTNTPTMLMPKWMYSMRELSITMAEHQYQILIVHARAAYKQCVLSDPRLNCLG